MTPERPDLFLRFLAKALDLGLATGLCLLHPFGNIIGIIYVLIGDALIDGSSPAKWLVGLKVVHKETGAPCGFKESVLRNLPFGFAAALLLIPVIGAVLALIVGILFIALESYFLYTDPESTRLGDILADTQIARVQMARRLRGRRPAVEETDADRETEVEIEDGGEPAEPGGEKEPEDATA